MEKTITSKTLYKGRVVCLDYDEVELDDGTRSIREVVKHSGGAAIALKDKDGRFMMVKQYRYAQKEDMIEVCAGKLNEGEDPQEAIVREVREELGYTLKELKYLGYIIPTCGYSSERIYLYYGEALEFVGTHFDRDERIESLSLSYSEITQMIKEGKISDAKTIAIFYHLQQEGIAHER